jgi:phospholipid/cholesterol/gamma-HCH transport system substrate-binding protein
MKTEAKVGAFVILCAAILLITVYKVSSAQIRGARVSYKTYLRYAGGLEPGADVLFGGITVGAVTAVHPDPQDPTRIEILFDVKLGTPMNAKSIARLESVTLVTNPVVSITTGTNDAPRLQAGSVIPSEETISVDDAERKFVAVADSAHTLLDAAHTDIDNMTGDARKLMANLNQITDKANQEHIASVLANADTIMTHTAPKIDQISDQVVSLTKNANGVVAKVGPAVDNLNQTISDADATITAFREPGQADLVEMRKTLSDLQASMRAKDRDITYTLENLRMITDNLNELTESVKERPWSLVRIREPKDRKVPPTSRAH